MVIKLESKSKELKKKGWETLPTWLRFINSVKFGIQILPVPNMSATVNVLKPDVSKLETFWLTKILKSAGAG